jgi:multidrug efflux pump subunit AcrA (membrane-fusion protein)
MKKTIPATYQTIIHTIRKFYKKVTQLLLTKPRNVFIGLLVTLTVLIVVGNFLSKPKPAPNETIPAKSVQIFSIGSSPKIRTNGKIEKSGSIKIIAQQGGIVQKLYKKEGDTISKGQWLAWISTNYQGGTAPTVTRQIAEKNYSFVTENFDTQKELLGKRRDLANTVNTQASDLRDITGKSIDDTKNLLTLNESIANTLADQIKTLEKDNADHSNDALILQTKQSLAQVQSGLLNLRSGLRNSEYQSAGDKAPANLATIQKDLTVKQLDLEEKSLELNKQLSKLNLTVSQIMEALMYPASPVTGIVERVYVSPGQSINPGTPIAAIAGNKNSIRLIVAVPKHIAINISKLEKATVYLGEKTLDLTPLSISLEPTEGNLNSVIFILPEDAAENVTNGSSVAVDLPVGSGTTLSALPYIPIDAIYQTESGAYVSIASQSGETWHVMTKNIQLGSVYGDYVGVTEGLTGDEQIILDRSVIDGEKVEIVKETGRQ